MTAPSQDPGHARGVQLFHGVLVGGLLMITAAFVLVLRLRRIDALVPGAGPAGYVLAGLGGLGLALAASVLRSRVPQRLAGESPDAYWAKPENRGAAIMVWVVCDGAGITPAIGYLVTGNPVPLAVTLLAVGVLVALRPARLATPR